MVVGQVEAGDVASLGARRVDLLSRGVLSGLLGTHRVELVAVVEVAQVVDLDVSLALSTAASSKRESLLIRSSVIGLELLV